MTQRRLTWSVVALCLALLTLAVALRLLFPANPVTLEQAARKVRNGMTRANVHAFLGEPPPGGRGRGWGQGGWEVWNLRPDREFHVGYDEDDVVVVYYPVDGGRPLTVLYLVREWLGWW